MIYIVDTCSIDVKRTLIAYVCTLELLNIDILGGEALDLISAQSLYT